MMVRTVALFQSTLPGWGATGDMFHRFFDDRDISIHAPRMGSDLSDDYDPTHGRFEFQSTLPGWGATTAHRNVTRTASYFNPRSPDGERRNAAIRSAQVRQISIHAPRMGSDTNVDTRRLLPC